MFVIDGESLESVQRAILDYRKKVLGENLSSCSMMMSRQDNSLRDVEVEVVSYKKTLDGESSEPLEVKTLRSFGNTFKANKAICIDKRR